MEPVILGLLGTLGIGGVLCLIGMVLSAVSLVLTLHHPSSQLHTTWRGESDTIAVGGEIIKQGSHTPEALSSRDPLAAGP